MEYPEMRKPNPTDLSAVVAVFEVYGSTSGLRVNRAKSAAMPIRCSQEQMLLVGQILGCSVGQSVQVLGASP